MPEGKKENLVKLPPNEGPVYDPKKQYTWPNDAKFELTGHQFSLWLNSTRSKISSKDAMEYRLAFESSDIIEKIMAAGVASGVIIEQPVKEEK
jgi:hypothetical protein